MTLEDGEAAPATGTRRRGFFRRWIRRLFALGVLVVALPVVMVPLYTVVPPVSTLMVFDALARGGVSRTYVPIEEISPHLVRAVLMSEDGRFCEHRGVDWDALYEVLESADAEGPTRGASTIPMQTAKNLFLWNGRSYVRKAMEIPLALYMDLVWSKRRMMEIYLNIAEWGPGVYGAEAGAQAHFGKPAAALTAREAALMAVSLPNPHARNPGNPSRRLAGLARIIEARAAKSGGYVGCVLGSG